MTIPPVIKKVERRVFSSFFQDGSLEAFVGIFMLQLGLPVFFSRNGFGDLESALIVLPIVLVLLGAVFAVRRWIVIPRLGNVKFLPERKRALSKLVIVPTIALVAGIITGYFAAENAARWNAFIGLLPLGLLPLIILCAAAYFMNIRRLYIYGALISLVPVSAKFLENVTLSRNILPATVLVTALIFFIVAIVFFVLFLHKYPGFRAQND